MFQYFRDSDKFRRKNVIKNLVLDLIFLMISGFWIGLISFKDNGLSIGTAGKFNHALVGPQSIGFADYSQGIHKPGQYDPNFLPKDWNPFESWSNFNYQLSLIWSNILKIVSILNYFSFLSLLIILAYIMMCIQPPHKLVSQNLILYPIVTLLISVGGYIIITVEERYLWLIYVLLIVMGGYLINLIFKKDLFSKTKFYWMIKTVFLLIFAFSFIFMPLNYLVQNVHTDEDIYNLSGTLMTP